MTNSKFYRNICRLLEIPIFTNTFKVVDKNNGNMWSKMNSIYFFSEKITECMSEF